MFSRGVIDSEDRIDIRAFQSNIAKSADMIMPFTMDLIGAPEQSIVETIFSGMSQMFELQVVIESHDPFPFLQRCGIVHENKLHVIEMGFVEFLVFVPIERDVIKLNLRKKNMVLAGGNHHREKGICLAEMDVA